MKTILIAILVIFASCSENDPEPQISCDQLKSEIEAVSKSIQEHYAKGSEGNQDAWEKELTRLNSIKTEKSNEYYRRAC